eukprot:Protomagalhaensia_wolfi_Nauph_80__6353@NODE_999_length_1821_cov_36_976431_g756_i0_p3_GENE_NODE_999_length_1821_cov_36_976431_g756_i0NODE_999_length_1821_cov_36_976431_g756_i0_p3_ORF_typecomplete_len191_score43_05OxoGdeHyase_C/PF16870_5/1_5e50_NODE_999_length_1821_cov_36_976431_g756_i0239811
MSPLIEFEEGTRFARYIRDPTFERPQNTAGDIGVGVAEAQANAPVKSRAGVKRLILCSGQVYYDLVKARRDAKLEDDIMIVRVEQLSPFPFDQVANDLDDLPNMESVVWCQEEPMNQGPWTYVGRRIDAVLKHLKYPKGIHHVMYVGRDVAGSTAVGDIKIHTEQQNRLCQDAMDLTRVQNSYYEEHLRD